MANESGTAGTVSWAWLPGWTEADRAASVRALLGQFPASAVEDAREKVMRLICGPPDAVPDFSLSDDPPDTPRLRHDPAAEAEETRRCLERARLHRGAVDLAQALFGWLS